MSNFKTTPPKIDWLTVSIPFKLNQRVMAEGFTDYVGEELHRLFKEYFWLDDLHADDAKSWEWGAAIRPYPMSIRHLALNVLIGFGGKHEQATVWISGTAIETMRRNGTLQAALQDITERKLSVSRLDLAVDFTESDVTPIRVFAAIAGSAKHKTQQWTESKSGTTFTLGSRKSARYARMYRYNNREDRPHTRLEIEIKGKSAQAALWKCVNFDVESVFYKACAQMSLNITPSKQIPEMPTLDIEKKGIANSNSRLVWLNSQVIPAVRNMIDRGEIKLLDFVEALT